MDGSDNGENSRQPPKRDGDPIDQDQDGQPIPKRASPSTLTPSEPVGHEEEPSSSGGTGNPVDNVAVNLRRIFGDIEQVLGLSMVDLARLFERNEVALRNLVRYLREALTHHRSHLEPFMQDFLEALGPGIQVTPSPSVPLITIDPPSTPQVTAQPSVPQASIAAASIPNPVFTEMSGKGILRLLGQILVRLAQLGNVLSHWNSKGTDQHVDRNLVARTLSQVLNELGEQLQYTFMINLDQLAGGIEAELKKWKAEMDTAVMISNAADDTDSQPQVIARILQMIPRLVYPNLQEPEARYEIRIPSDDLRALEPEMTRGSSHEQSPPQSTLSSASNNLQLRYGTEELVAGMRTTRIDYIVQGVRFRIGEAFNTNGWIHPSGTDGVSIRWIEFDTNQFEDGTEIYRIEERPRTSGGETNGSDFVAVVSGIPSRNEAYKLIKPGQRIEFVFRFPVHLSRQQINDVGIRNGTIKIQFAK